MLAIFATFKTRTKALHQGLGHATGTKYAEIEPAPKRSHRTVSLQQGFQ